MDNNNNASLVDERGRGSWLKTALVISLALHLAVVVAVLRTPLGGVPATPAATQPVIAVMLRQRIPAAPAGNAAEDNDGATPANAGIGPLPPPAPIPQQSGPSGDAVASNSRETPPNIETQENTGDGPSPTVLDAAQLSASVARYIETFDAQQQKTWLEQCQRFRNRYFTQDCTVDPSVRTGSSDIPASVIGPLLDDDSPLGELARERYALVPARRNFQIIKTREEQLLGPTVMLIGFGNLGSGALMNNWLTRSVLGALGVVIDPIPAPSFVEPGLQPDTSQTPEELDGLPVFEKAPSLFGN